MTHGDYIVDIMLHFIKNKWYIISFIWLVPLKDFHFQYKEAGQLTVAIKLINAVIRTYI